MDFTLQVLDKPDNLHEVEELQKLIWPGSDVDVVPSHLLKAATQHGGILIGARPGEGEQNQELVGFVFGFPGYYTTPDGPRLMHYSHMMGVHPKYRDAGLGYRLKRAQWQIVRHQGLDRIEWTYDPLLSRNANLNISKLGAVCNTYLENFYGDMQDELNTGLPSDRFQVDWWVNSRRVERRLSRQVRKSLDLAHFLDGGAVVINPSLLRSDGLPQPVDTDLNGLLAGSKSEGDLNSHRLPSLLIVEIPSDYLKMKELDMRLAREWRMHSRLIFETLFKAGYLVTDYVYLPGSQSHSYYVLSHGESTL